MAPPTNADANAAADHREGRSGTGTSASACLRGASAGRTGSYGVLRRVRIDILGVAAGP